jgi:hypothetical protein
MLDIVKIRFKIPFYSRITVKSKAQLRDCFVMHLFLERVMHGVIAQLKQLCKVRTSETYTTTLNNFMAFRDEQDVPLDFLSLRLGALNEKKIRHLSNKMAKIRVFRKSPSSSKNSTFRLPSL